MKIFHLNFPKKFLENLEEEFLETYGGIASSADQIHGKIGMQITCKTRWMQKPEFKLDFKKNMTHVLVT